MIRFQVQCLKPGTIIHCAGLVESLVATTGNKAEIVTYVKNANVAAFRTALRACDHVTYFSEHAVDIKTDLALKARTK